MKNIFVVLRNLRKKNYMGIDVLNGLLYLNAKQIPLLKNKVKKYSEGMNSKEFLIFHYTASTTAKSAHNTYLDPALQVSWHLTIDRDGNVTQLLPLDKIAWHAGKSYWKEGKKEYTSLNPVSIGIEMVNAGPLYLDNGSYYTWFKQMLPLDDVFFDSNGNPWQKYTAAQLNTASILGVELAKLLRVKNILGHEEISPGSKKDPGPAFWHTLKKIRNSYNGSRILR